MDDAHATRSAVARLRHDTGGSDPWSESGGSSRCRGGFAWRDEHGNQFDIMISLIRLAPRTPTEHEAASLRGAWQTVMLGDDAACTVDPQAWRFATECRQVMWGSEKSWAPRRGDSGRPNRFRAESG
ncbi:hypothetical protein [Emcibacter sp. SYSU 3D8]|uniref:hypothetical protein n=1 Tax=Emcibacter sp. SYSU 3D8 TaxID=3133969 RepID=UPI0031FE8FF7